MSWTPTTKGYELNGNTLERTPKGWKLTRTDGSVQTLKRSATFDDAEALLEETEVL